MAKIKQTVNRFIRRMTLRRKYKDNLFRRCFDNKKGLLELYNALNGTKYANIDELKITTPEIPFFAAAHLYGVLVTSYF